MSIKLGLDSAQEILVIALMIVFVFAVLYSDMEFMYKVGIAVLVFSVIFLASLANQILKQDKEKRRF
jgi:hypothetical protein